MTSAWWRRPARHFDDGAPRPPDLVKMLRNRRGRRRTDFGVRLDIDEALRFYFARAAGHVEISDAATI